MLVFERKEIYPQYNTSCIYGSVRSDRQGIKLVKFLTQQLQNKEISVSIIDPMELQLPLLDKMHKEYAPGEAPLPMQMIHDILVDVDGYIIVSGEYNHSIPPALSNLLGHFQSEYYFKPAALAVYAAGGFGGARVQDAFDVDGKDKSGKFEARSKGFIDEFEWYLKTLKDGQKYKKPY